MKISHEQAQELYSNADEVIDNCKIVVSQILIEFDRIKTDTAEHFLITVTNVDFWAHEAISEAHSVDKSKAQYLLYDNEREAKSALLMSALSLDKLV